MYAGATLAWSQGNLLLPGPSRSESGIEITSLAMSVGLVAARNTYVGFELLGEAAVMDLVGTPDVLLLSGSAVLDHETLDRIDFPRRGADLHARWEWGLTDLTPDEGFSLFMTRGRIYLPADELAAWLADDGPLPSWPGLDLFTPALPHSARHASIRLAFEAAAEAAEAAAAKAPA